MNIRNDEFRGYDDFEQSEQFIPYEKYSEHSESELLEEVSKLEEASESELLMDLMEYMEDRFDMEVCDE